MAHCNSCGRYMKPTENVYKRQLYSGQSNRTYYGKRINFSSSTHYSMKNVCFECSKSIDQKNEDSNKLMLSIAFIIIILFALFYML